MNKKSRKKLLLSLKKFENNRESCLKILKKNSGVVVGTIYTTRRRCGKSGCKCAKVPSHNQTLLRYSKQGVQKCKLVRKADTPRIQMAWEQYVKCRDAIKILKVINQKEIKILMDLIKLRRIHYE